MSKQSQRTKDLMAFDCDLDCVSADSVSVHTAVTALTCFQYGQRSLPTWLPECPTIPLDFPYSHTSHRHHYQQRPLSRRTPISFFSLVFSSVYAVIVCPSVCPSQVGVLRRRLNNLGSRRQRCTIAKGL